MIAGGKILRQGFKLRQVNERVSTDMRKMLRINL